MRITNVVFLLFTCCFIQSCGRIKPSDEIRKGILDKNQKIIDSGFKVELNLFDCVSDTFLVSTQESFKDCLGNAFSAPVSILSAPLDSIFSLTDNYNFRYTPFLIEGKVIDIIVKRAHYVETGTSVGAEGKDTPIRKIVFEEKYFLQLETEGKIIYVLLDEQGIYDETIGSVERRAKDTYLKPQKINKEKLYRQFSGNSQQPFKKGSTVYLAVATRYSPNPESTIVNSIRDPEIDRLEKESKSDIYDLSFWKEDKNRMAFIYFIRPHKVFNSKQELLKAVDKDAERSLNEIFMYLACD